MKTHKSNDSNLSHFRSAGGVRLTTEQNPDASSGDWLRLLVHKTKSTKASVGCLEVVLLSGAEWLTTRNMLVVRCGLADFLAQLLPLKSGTNTQRPTQSTTKETGRLLFV